MLYNKEFKEACEAVYSPRNAFCISRDDGKMNPSINVFKDILINLNSLVGIGRYKYNQNQLAKIEEFKYTEVDEKFRWWVLVAGFLLLLEFVLKHTLLRNDI